MFERSRAQELRVAVGEWRLAARRSHAARAGAIPAPREPESAGRPETPRDDRIRITAPLVGIFREGDRRLAVGDLVAAESSVGAIESMKLLSPVFADTAGQVEEVLVEDGHPVEYGEPLFVLNPRPLAAEQESGA